MSEQVERRLVEMLGNPTEAPYGNPIPALDDLGTSPSVRFLAGVVSLVAHVRSHPGETRVVVRRLGEPAQFDMELLAQLKQTGVMPGAEAVARAVPGGVRIEVDGFEDALELPTEVAVHVFVGA